MATSLNLGGVNWKSSNSKTPYTDMYNQYAKYRQASRDAYVSGLDKQLTADKNTTNGQYNSTAKQYYVQNMQAQKSLPSQLASNGVTGGASESAIIRMNNAYGNNLATNESGRASALNTLQNTYNSNVASYDKDYQSDLASAYKTSMENQLTYEKEQKEQDLKYYANSITGRYNSNKAWKKAISNLKKSNDSNAKYKLALAQQAYNKWKSSQKKSSSSSSGSSGSGYSSGYSSYGTSSSSGSTSSSKKKSSKKKSSKKSSKKTTTKTYSVPAWRVWGM